MLQTQDRTNVSEEVAKLDESLAELGAVESKLSKELDDIRAKMEKLHTQRATLKSRMAPIWILPNEILSHIFELGMNDDDDDDDDNDEDDKDGYKDEQSTYLDFQVLISHVCRTFREVVTHTPTLWTHIHVFGIKPNRYDYAKTFVQRSGCAPLDILVYWDEGLEEGTLVSYPLKKLMGLFLPHISRWQRFMLRLRGFDSLRDVMRELDRPAPLLEVLEISDVDYEKAFDEEDPFEPAFMRSPLTIFAGRMPKLQEISLDGVHIAWRKCNLANLFYLHLGYHTRDVRPTYEEFKAIIDASPALRCLDLRGSAPLIAEDGGALYPPLQMECLMELRLSDLQSDYSTTLISLINAPNLQSLRLSDLDTNDYSPFFRRISGPPALFPALTGIKLAAIEISDDTFEGLLRAYSNITYLGLYFNQLPTIWLDYLMPRGPDNEVLCPKLECLRCVSAPTSEIKKVLEKRKDAGFPIPALEIDKDTESWGTTACLEWIRDNTTVEIIEPSEHGSDDEELDGYGTDWASDDDDDDDDGMGMGVIGFPYFSMEGFSDEDDDDDDDGDGDENMEVDGSHGSVSEGEEEEWE